VVESEVAKIVERAQERATEIEDQALDKAGRIERSSDRRSHQVLEDSRQRIALILSEVDAIERSLGEAVDSLRVEAKRLTGRIDRAQSEPLLVPEPEPEAPASGPDSRNGDFDAQSDAAAAQPTEDAPRQVSVLEVREMIRQQLLSLAEAGRTRADAQRMLLRFKEGEQFFDLLDEIYPEDEPSRRGLLRRRKAKS